MSAGENGIKMTAPATVTAAGTSMLPVPRMIAASELNIQIRVAPANTRLE